MVHVATYQGSSLVPVFGATANPAPIRAHPPGSELKQKQPGQADGEEGSGEPQQEESPRDHHLRRDLREFGQIRLTLTYQGKLAKVTKLA